MERRSFLKVLGASSAALGLSSLNASELDTFKQNQKILVDAFSKNAVNGEKIELNFLKNYAHSSQILKNSLKANEQVIGVLSAANFMLLNEFLPKNSSITNASVDNNLVYFSLKGNKNV